VTSCYLKLVEAAGIASAPSLRAVFDRPRYGRPPAFFELPVQYRPNTHKKRPSNWWPFFICGGGGRNWTGVRQTSAFGSTCL